MEKIQISIGLRIGRIRVMQAVGERGRAFIIECDCGARRRVMQSYLESRAHSTCGHKCPLGSHAEIHGQSVSPSGAYESWGAMLDRCYNANHVFYCRYGGRGIAVCERWRHSFENFLMDMGPRPAGKTLDRFPNRDGNYESENCRWATAKEQSDNRSTTRFVLLNGETMCLSDAARALELSHAVLKWRLRELFPNQYASRELVDVGVLAFPPHRGKPLKNRI